MNTEVHTTSKKLAEDKLISQELAKRQTLKMEDAKSKNKFLYKHFSEFERWQKTT